MPTDLTKARQLFGTFSKIGAFTFGGGYAMIPLIQREVTERRRWLEDRDILDIVAIAESTPGPIAINTATFVGYQVCGTLGAFCATLGVVLPSFLVIYAVSFVLRQFSDLAVVQYAFNGIRELEVFYNVRLFERMNRRVYLTEAGRTLRQYADTVLSQFQESVEVLRESGAQGACRFGVHVTLGETRLAGILAHLAEALPEITVRASIHNSRETERMILQNELDFAVVDNVTVSPHYLVEPLCGEELAAVCAPGYLEGKNSLTLAELAEERLLLRERGSGTRNSVDAGLQGAGATAQPVVESVSTAALLACARAGLGITLLPRSLVVTDLERGDLRELAVEDGGFHRSYFLVRHRSKYLTDGMKRVIRVLREHLGGEQP